MKIKYNHYNHTKIKYNYYNHMKIKYNHYRGRRNRWPVASIFTVGPVKQNKDQPAGPVDILGPLGPATFVSSNR